MAEEETNLGLIGTIIITRKGKERSRDDPTPKDVDQEFISLYTIFNEENDEEPGLKHAINGRIFGNLAGYQTNWAIGFVGILWHWVMKLIIIRFIGTVKRYYTVNIVLMLSS